MSALLKALPYLTAVVAGLAWTALAYHLGGEAYGNAVRLEWQAERTANARTVLNALERTLDAERGLGETLAARDAQHQLELEHVQAQKDFLQRQLDTGHLRVSVPTRPAAGRPIDPASPAPASESQEARAELDPAFAAALAGIAGDGDSAITDLNACIDRYNAVRDAAAALNHAQAQ